MNIHNIFVHMDWWLLDIILLQQLLLLRCWWSYAWMILTAVKCPVCYVWSAAKSCIRSWEPTPRWKTKHMSWTHWPIGGAQCTPVVSDKGSWHKENPFSVTTGLKLVDVWTKAFVDTLDLNFSSSRSKSCCCSLSTFAKCRCPATHFAYFSRNWSPPLKGWRADLSAETVGTALSSNCPTIASPMMSPEKGQLIWS